MVRLAISVSYGLFLARHHQSSTRKNISFGQLHFNSISFPEAFLKTPLVYVAAILIIIAYAKWNSEEETKDIKEAQLQALKRGKVSVELKGKMRKLK